MSNSANACGVCVKLNNATLSDKVTSLPPEDVDTVRYSLPVPVIVPLSVDSTNAAPPATSAIVNVVLLSIDNTKYSSPITIFPSPAPEKIIDMPTQSEFVVPQVIVLPELDVVVQNTVIGFTVAVPVPDPMPVVPGGLTPSSQINVIPTELLIAPINV